MRYLNLAILLLIQACSTLPSKTTPVLVPPETLPIATPSPVTPASGGVVLVTYDPASSIEKSFAQPAIDLMNKCFSSGKLKEKWLNHKFESFNTVFEKSPKTNLEAYEAFVKGAPYPLNLKWYYTWKGVVGYTYNFYDDSSESWESGKSETRIYSNSKVVAYYSPQDTAEHWAHELSHQARAGGFVHYTIFQGSTPYEAGDIMGLCIGELK